MILEVFLALLGIASIFSVISGLTNKRTFIIPAGLVFFLIGFVLVAGNGLEVQTGIGPNYMVVDDSYSLQYESKV